MTRTRRWFGAGAEYSGRKMTSTRSGITRLTPDACSPKTSNGGTEAAFGQEESLGCMTTRRRTVTHQTRCVDR